MVISMSDKEPLKPADIAERMYETVRDTPGAVARWLLGIALPIGGAWLEHAEAEDRRGKPRA
jgi:hypothetical protein